MITKLIASIGGVVAAGLIAAPVASADLSDLVNVDVVGSDVVVSPGPSWPIPFWDGQKDGDWSYKTGYNISPRYTFRTDPVTGKRTANYDTGCHHCGG